MAYLGGLSQIAFKTLERPLALLGLAAIKTATATDWTVRDRISMIARLGQERIERRRDG